MKAILIVRFLGISMLSLHVLHCSSKQSKIGTPPATPIPQISVKQAEELARKYFEKQFGYCGGPENAIDRGWYWEFPIKVGVAGKVGPKIKVDKYTGKVSSDSNSIKLLQ